MLVCLKMVVTPLRPPQRHIQRSPRPCPIRRILRALIERHRDVRAERDLHIHRVLRREEVRRPVDMRPERDPLVGHFAQIAQAENLKPARVREDHPIPAHEPVQSAHSPDRLMPRPQIKVIRIAQQNPHIQLLKKLLRNRLHRPLRPHRHKHRCLDSAMRQRHRRAPSQVTAPMDLKREGHLLIVATSYSSGSRSRSTAGMSRLPCRTAAISTVNSSTL